ncbi:MAG: Replication-associated recombination protein A [Dehalococcoidia bacterium]|nr:Replication-associated recombination protein A [Chloroflexota bacterium]
MDMSQFLFVEKYRPVKIEDCILPASLKKTFMDIRDSGKIPNMMLAGAAGTGKTTVAKALCAELGADVLVVNASLNAGIDALRTDIKAFASTVSFGGGRKIVILDEADSLGPAVQPALRNFIEEYSKNCGFILTCNFKNRIIEPLHSRCTVIDFIIPSSEKQALAAAFFKRTCGILEKEGIEFDKKAVAEVINKHFPDWRRVLNELQRYGAGGKIDSGILVSLADESFHSLIGLLKAKDWKGMRKWVAQNADNDSSLLFRKIYDSAYDFVKPNDIPALVMILGDYQYKAAHVADQEINMAAFLTVVMSEVAFQE